MPMAEEHPIYRVGVDVGARSLGLAAIEYSQHGQPLRILNSVVYIHDSGLDPEENKTAKTRKLTAGVARRTRRLIQRRTKRLKALDRVLIDLGLPVDPSPLDDPYAPWKLRAALATERMSDPKKQARALSVGLRHMARHRGWRSPYERVGKLYEQQEPSSQYLALKKRTEDAVGRSLPEGLTPAQIVAVYALTPKVRLRGPEGHLGGKLHQSDNAEEIRRIAEVQGFDDVWVRRVIDAVFAAESPRGSALKNVGKDALPGQTHLPRAPKVHSAFQEFRMVSILANIRVRVAGNKQGRTLTAAEKQTAFAYLANLNPTVEPTWAEVAEALKLERQDLLGVSKPTPDGERAGTRPPVNVTDRELRLAKKPKGVSAWWLGATKESRDALVCAITVGEQLTEGSPDEVAVSEFLAGLEDMEQASLDELASSLPSGRSPYSVDSLRRLTARMLESDDDLHAARMHVFGVADDWTPPADPIGAPVGNPAVDRVTKQFARWLAAIEAEFGVPQAVIIEHVRDGFTSERAAREMQRENEARRRKNEANLARMQEARGITSLGRRYDLMRYSAITRQNCTCLYCGGMITFDSCEMDHIIPRAGQGSTNRRENLVAVCERCNKSKGKKPFRVWAETCGIPGVSVAEAVERVKHWNEDGANTKDLRFLRTEVIGRLKRTDEDDPIDDRSMESVAWMANEVRARVAQHYKQAGSDVDVMVYRGGITAGARKASGLEWALPYYGAMGKTRLDRRHHAVDAAVLTLMDRSVARTLSERESIREAEKVLRTEETWKSYEGNGEQARLKFANWKIDMDSLQRILCDAIAGNQIPVMQNLRLRLANGAIHKDTVASLDTRLVGDEIPDKIINRASTPALWCALTRHPDYVPGEGLPANAGREIRVNGQHLMGLDSIGFFPSDAAAIAVRGGSAEIGSNIHHARVYRLPGKKPTYGMIRVFGVDLVKHQQEDLFSVELPPQSISMRNAEPKVAEAVLAGNAEYLGWMVVGDELKINMEPFGANTIGEFLQEYPGVDQWRLCGFGSGAKLRLRPALLAAEGLKEDAAVAARQVLDRPGWRPATNAVFSAGCMVVRRNSLGQPRRQTDAHLPTCWSSDDGLASA